MRFKSLLFVIVLLCFSTVLFAKKSKKVAKTVIHISLNCDHCKLCGTCGILFESELYKIRGLKRFDLNENEKTLTVYYNKEKTDLAEIKAYISNLGYNADEVKADPEAYEQLDDCCKK